MNDVTEFRKLIERIELLDGPSNKIRTVEHIVKHGKLPETSKEFTQLVYNLILKNIIAPAHTVKYLNELFRMTDEFYPLTDAYGYEREYQRFLKNPLASEYSLLKIISDAVEELQHRIALYFANPYNFEPGYKPIKIKFKDNVDSLVE